jgi:hypothetical protein
MSRRRNKGARDFQLWKSCTRKTAFETEAAAFQKGQRSYLCRHCGKWHRSGALTKLIVTLSKHEI